jgi:hypothetical protein
MDESLLAAARELGLEEGDAPLRILCPVARNSNKPILFLPGSPKKGYGVGLPKGEVEMRCGNRFLVASVGKIAINVMREEGSKANALPEILFGWFGPEAGERGTARRKVSITSTAGEHWLMEKVD